MLYCSRAIEMSFSERVVGASLATWSAALNSVSFAVFVQQLPNAPHVEESIAQ